MDVNKGMYLHRPLTFFSPTCSPTRRVPSLAKPLGLAALLLVGAALHGLSNAKAEDLFGDHAFLASTTLPAAEVETEGKAPTRSVTQLSVGLPQPAKSLQWLIEGNARFAAGRQNRPNQTPARREAVAEDQDPFAIVFTCSDSRVSPEIYFDRGIGDLFVIRDAGNVVNPHIVGSIEYAVSELNVPLIVVVGHERCGAVKAAASGHAVEGSIRTIVESIKPAVLATEGLNGDPIDNAISTHAQMSAQAIVDGSPIVASAVEEGRLLIYSARYDLDTGRVEFLPEVAFPKATMTTKSLEPAPTSSSPKLKVASVGKEKRR